MLKLRWLCRCSSFCTRRGSDALHRQPSHRFWLHLGDATGARFHVLRATGDSLGNATVLFVFKSDYAFHPPCVRTWVFMGLRTFSVVLKSVIADG